MATAKLPAHAYLGLIILAVSSMLLISRTEPVYSLFYIFAWWSYILLIDGLVYRYKGNSLLVDRTGEFLLLVPWSVFIWLIFEAFNIYIKNWYYVRIIDIRWLRWLGYFVAYGTVLPGLFETTEFLEAVGLYKKRHIRPLSPTKSWYGPFILLGLAFFILPVIWPQYFFPLVWGCFVFLLEPINHHFGGRSLMRDWQQGSLRKFSLLLTAGFICGVFWELWNFWAGSKWVYTVPFVEQFKVFEMPIAGYLGFPPFAVECYVIYNFISLLRENKGWEEGSIGIQEKTAPYFVLAAMAIIVSYAYIMFQAIDQKTVHSFAPIFY
jgi:hypothetical protein